MGEMVERLARALCKRDGGNFDGPSDTPLGRLWRDAYRDEARAAIAEIREPTDAMLTAAINNCATDRYSGIWRELIDAALEN